MALESVKTCLKKILDQLDALGMKLDSSRAKFLAMFHANLYSNKSLYDIFESQRKYEENDIDAAIDSVLRFRMRSLGYVFPNYLRALERIVNDVATYLGIEPVSFSAFASFVENRGRDSLSNLFEEIGVPEQITKKLIDQGFRKNDTPSDTILSLKEFVENSAVDRYLSEFERWIMRGVVEHI